MTSKTSFNDTLFNFSVTFAACVRLFTARQLATYPAFSGLSQPHLRARQFLWAHSDTFEKTRGAGNEPWLWRLTTSAKRKYGLLFRNVAGDTQRREHWLGLGDLWLALTYSGGRPTQWIIDPQCQFDVDLIWNGIHVLVEYQRSPLTSKRWADKWSKRRTWYKEQKFKDSPFVLLVVTTDQPEAVIGKPDGTILCRDIHDVPRALKRVKVK